MHDAGGGVAQQRLHVDAGPEVLQPAGDVLLRGGAVVGLAPLPVPHPLGEQHGAVDDEDRQDRVEAAFHADGMLPKTSRCTGESSCHCRAVAAMPDTMTITAKPTPMPRASWVGLMRRLDAARWAPAGRWLLTRPNLPNGGGGGIGAAAGERLPGGHLSD